jgi:cytochrome c
MMRIFLAVALACLVPLPSFAQDVAEGANVFRRCAACHSVGEGAANRMGPVLNDIVGKPAGTVEGFNFSNAMKQAGEAGLVWTPETLAPFLRKPRDFMPGNKMSFGGIPNDEDLANVIAYLVSLSPDYTPVDAAGEPAAK